MLVRGIRGAITINEDKANEIYAATQCLLEKICTCNQIQIDDIVSVIFTVTPDIKAAFPATAARAMGWDNVPLLCCQEIAVEKSIPLCIRVLMHINTSKLPQQIEHIYLRKASQLRPDITLK